MIPDKLLKPARGSIRDTSFPSEWNWFWKIALNAVPMVEQGGVVVRDYARRQQRDLVSMLPSDWVIGPHGPEIFFGTNEDDYLSLDHNAIDGETDISIFYECLTDSTAIQSPVSAASAGSDNEILVFNFSATGITFFHGAGASVVFTLPSITGNRNRYWWERDQTNSEVRLYLNDLAVDIKSTGAMSALSVDDGGFLLGQEQDSVGGGFSGVQRLIGRMSYFYVLRGTPTDGQRRQLMNDPFGPFRTDSNIIPFVAPAAGGWAHKINGVTSPGKVNGVANANIGKINGVAA